MTITIKKGIHLESELKKYQKDAETLRRIRQLHKEIYEAKALIKSNAQEIAKLLGVTEKYKISN